MGKARIFFITVLMALSFVACSGTEILYTGYSYFPPKESEKRLELDDGMIVNGFSVASGTLGMFTNEGSVIVNFAIKNGKITISKNSKYLPAYNTISRDYTFDFHTYNNSVFFDGIEYVTNDTFSEVLTNAPTETIPSVGDVIQFGGYDWKVLDILDGKMFILSDTVLKDKAYNEEWGELTWETCTLRKYLNNDFYNSFGANEQARIVDTKIVNNDNLLYGTFGGNDTTDKIYLLSLEEVLEYFGDSGGNINFDGDINDQYNEVRIAYGEDGESVSWWLRTPGLNGAFTTRVNFYGYIQVAGIPVHYDDGYGGVRPALWLNLE